MKNLILLLALSSTALGSFAQSFYVEPLDSGNDRHLKEKLKFEGYELTPYKDQADYIIGFSMEKTDPTLWSYPSKLNEGVVTITDKMGSELAISEGVVKGANLYNGYNAENAILKELAKKHLTKTIQKALKETAAK